MPPGELDGFLGVPRLAHQLERVLRGDQPRQRLPDVPVVVGHQDTHAGKVTDHFLRVFVPLAHGLKSIGWPFGQRERTREASTTPFAFSISSRSCGDVAASTADSTDTLPPATSSTSDWSNVRIP